MDVIQVIKESARLAWDRKAWWVFGLFVAASGSVGAGSGGGGASGGAGSGGGEAGLPVWLTGVEIVVVVAAIGAMLMNIISEGALIEGASRGDMTVREGMRLGWSHFGVVLRIKLLVFGAGALSVALFAAPGWLFALGLIPGLAAAFLAVPAVLVAVPWLITIYLMYAFALRIAVLENRHAIDAIQKARLFLHGRVLAGLKLIVAMAVGQVGLVIAGVLALVPVIGIAAALYFMAGLAPGAVVGGALALPIALGLGGTLGSYRSLVWTLGYIAEARG
jgi:hypothetical protein